MTVLSGWDVRLSSYDLRPTTSSTDFPNTSIIGRTPSPGSRDADIRPCTRCGAPSANFTGP
jgi:hypothetical protein